MSHQPHQRQDFPTPISCSRKILRPFHIIELPGDFEPTSCWVMARHSTAQALTMRCVAVASVLMGFHHASGFVAAPSTFARARQGTTTSTRCATTTMKLAQVPFSKYQGLGNDFILVDNREAEELMLTPEESAGLCDRWGGTSLSPQCAEGVIAEFSKLFLSSSCELCLLHAVCCTTRVHDVI